VLLVVLENLRFAYGLNEKIQGVTLLVLNEATLDDGVVSDVVWLNVLGHHFLEHFDSLLDHESLDASLDHTREDKDAGFDPFSLHFVEDPESFVNAPHPLVNLCEDRVCDVACFDPELLHILVAFHGHLSLVGFEASIQQ
jgi:hypothetical protein